MRPPPTVAGSSDDKGELAELRASVAASLTETLPAMVADSVRAAEEEHRAALEAARHDMARLRAESEATAAELREAVADLRAAALVQRSEAVERQAAASEQALDDMRSAMARPTAGAARATGGPRAVTLSAATSSGATNRSRCTNWSQPSATRCGRPSARSSEGRPSPGPDGWSAGCSRSTTVTTSRGARSTAARPLCPSCSTATTLNERAGKTALCPVSEFGLRR